MPGKIFIVDGVGSCHPTGSSARFSVHETMQEAQDTAKKCSGNTAIMVLPILVGTLRRSAIPAEVQKCYSYGCKPYNS